MATFRAHLADGSRAGLEAATRLYQDELLTGLTLRDSPAFEEWLRAERSTLTGSPAEASRGLHEHVRRRETEAGDRRRALCWRSSRGEEAHRELMLLLARSGQRSAALAEYETCRRSLHEELGAEPARGDGGPLPAPGGGAPPGAVEGPAPAGPSRPLSAPALPALPPAGPCVGRETELAHLAAHLAGPARRLVTLVGLGGAGKTRPGPRRGRTLPRRAEPGGARRGRLRLTGKGPAGRSRPGSALAPLRPPRSAHSLRPSLRYGPAPRPSARRRILGGASATPWG